MTNDEQKQEQENLSSAAVFFKHSSNVHFLGFVGSRPRMKRMRPDGAFFYSTKSFTLVANEEGPVILEEGYRGTN
jgi:hypothetical protein